MHLTHTIFKTYQRIIPLLNVIDGMHTHIKLLHDNESLNPEEQVLCEELLNCLLHFPRIRSTAGALDKVFCPEFTGILQCSSNVFLPESRKIINTAEVSIVIQATNVPFSKLSIHQIEAKEQDFCVMGCRVHKELDRVLAPSTIHEEVREGFVKNVNGGFYAIWDEEERVEWA